MDEVGTSHNTGNIMTVSGLSLTHTKENDSFLSLPRHLAVVSLLGPHLAKEEVGEDRGSTSAK